MEWEAISHYLSFVRCCRHLGSSLCSTVFTSENWVNSLLVKYSEKWVLCSRRHEKGQVTQNADDQLARWVHVRNNYFNMQTHILWDEDNAGHTWCEPYLRVGHCESPLHNSSWGTGVGIEGKIRIWDWKWHCEMESSVQFSADSFPKGKMGEESPEKRHQSDTNLRNRKSSCSFLRSFLSEILLNTGL